MWVWSGRACRHPLAQQRAHTLSAVRLTVTAEVRPRRLFGARGACKRAADFGQLGRNLA